MRINSSKIETVPFSSNQNPASKQLAKPTQPAITHPLPLNTLQKTPRAIEILTQMQLLADEEKNQNEQDKEEINSILKETLQLFN